MPGFFLAPSGRGAFSFTSLVKAVGLAPVVARDRQDRAERLPLENASSLWGRSGQLAILANGRETDVEGTDAVALREQPHAKPGQGRIVHARPGARIVIEVDGSES